MAEIPSRNWNPMSVLLDTVDANHPILRNGVLSCAVRGLWILLHILQTPHPWPAYIQQLPSILLSF